MSNIYILEPPTSGKILLQTTAGDIEIELWPKEAPKACRNFVQLCLEGYYNNTIFHRVVPDFIIQGGDPSGTGDGGESIYGESFSTEIHSRLRFVRRGIVAMASNEEGEINSQFFITLAPTPELTKMNTIFGTVIGDSIYNVLKIGEGEIDSETERPVYPKKIINTLVVSNPKKQLLSFGQDEDLVFDNSDSKGKNKTKKIASIYDIKNSEPETIKKEISNVHESEIQAENIHREELSPKASLKSDKAQKEKKKTPKLKRTTLS
ncbi:hypothetical protein BB560_005094 [Smittium megazygosporum]|uniref:Peptidyl-prolyl cis-trans isomerase n=1 Tax=Smittium megazygosporum TaxID=133381 RepID=A0A2T9Z7E4_9FUNG|nr:hypothetical protein BB560_005094 [Smittium megazygosporum]